MLLAQSRSDELARGNLLNREALSCQKEKMLTPIFRHSQHVGFTDQGQRFLSIQNHFKTLNTHLFMKRFSSVEMQMRAVGIGNEGEYVIKFICVVKRLDLLYDQVLVEVGGHFCYGR